MIILLVEDDQRTANFIKRGLEEEGYTVDVASTGEEGQSLAETQQYDLLILDIMLPGKDGISVCKALRQQKITNPILMLTAKGAVTDRVTGLDTGADDYLLKPFDFEELSARVRALLRRESKTTNLLLTAGGLVMDTLTRKVTINDKDIEFTGREYAILEYLLRHQGILMTRTQLAQHIWNQEFDSTSNLVDVYIKRVRHKIGDEDGTLIQTIRGAGYRFGK